MFSKSTFGTRNNPFGFSSTNMNPQFNQQSTPLTQPTSNSFAQNNNSIFLNNTYNNPNNYSFDSQNGSKMDISQNHSTGNFENNISNEQIGTPVKFCVSKNTESVSKSSGFSQIVNLAYQSITCMKEYEDKSFEELRVEDYKVNRRGPQHGFFSKLPTPFFGSTEATLNSSNSLFGQKDVNSVFGRSIEGVNQTNVNFGYTSVKNTNTGIIKKSTGFGANANTSSVSPFNSTNNLFESNTSYNLPFPSPSPFGQPTAFSSQATSGLHNSSGVSQNTSFLNQNNDLFRQNKTVSFDTSIPNINPLGIFGQPNAQNNNFAFPVPKTNTATTNFNKPSFAQNQTLLNPFLNKTNASVLANRQKSNSLGGSVLPMAELNSLFKSNACKPNTMLNNNIPQRNSLSTTSFNIQETVSQLGRSNQNQSQINKEQQILLPYGTSILDNIATIDQKFKELTKPTNPKELNSVLKNLKEKPSISDDKMTPVQAFRQNEPLFTGLENYDENLTFNIGISNPKRLVLRSSTNPYSLNDNDSSSPENLLNTDTDHLVEETVLDELKSLQRKVSNDYRENKLSSETFNNFEPTTKNYTNINISLKPSSRMEKSDNNKQGTETKETHIKDTDPKRLDIRSSSNKSLYSLNDIDSSSAENLLNTDTDHLVEETVFDELKSLQKKVSNDYRENTLSSETFNNFEPTTKSLTNINISLKLSSGMEKSDDNKQGTETKETHSEDKVEEEAGTNSSSTDGPVIHPSAGIILTRPEYYTIPSMENIINYVDKDGACLIQGFTVGRHGYGNVCFPDTIDVSNLNLDEIVHFHHKLIIVYPDDSKKPPIDQGLNRKAQVTLDKVYPTDCKTNAVVTNVDDLIRTGYSSRLQKLCEKLKCHFIDYKPETGSWVFKVDHF